MPFVPISIMYCYHCGEQWPERDMKACVQREGWSLVASAHPGHYEYSILVFGRYPLCPMCQRLFQLSDEEIIENM